MNDCQKFFSFIGGANLDILKNCPAEQNGFTAVGIAVVNVLVLSLSSMALAMYGALNHNLILSFSIAVFYTFIVFIGFWGILSVFRKSVKYPIFIRVFISAAVLLTSSVPVYIIHKYIFYFFNAGSSYSRAAGTIFIVLFTLMLYAIPVVIRLFIQSSNYEHERERVEQNFITQKEADIKAYRIKYDEYSVFFNEAKIKMEFIRHLADVTKEYHLLVRNTQKETFDFLDRLTKLNTGDNKLLEDCKVRVSEDFKTTLDMMSKVFAMMKE